MSTGATRCAGDVSGTGAVTYGPAMTTSTSAAAGRTVDLADVFARLDCGRSAGLVLATSGRGPAVSSIG